MEKTDLAPLFALWSWGCRWPYDELSFIVDGPSNGCDCHRTITQCHATYHAERHPESPADLINAVKETCPPKVSVSFQQSSTSQYLRRANAESSLGPRTNDTKVLIKVTVKKLAYSSNESFKYDQSCLKQKRRLTALLGLNNSANFAANTSPA
ncbi:hypothetical protein VFPPC_16538 [Pochonia chlamydosporia 170]|uniref:Uncharacterized protein n=1 Tax=Pochonia chlamydosporia 170 TaxID=1380566 RepID=A0A179F8I5_METCM|nr:hypothetical protein VFPPC_16538 [Pochonia chlamydosporia 170]OAQ61650.1 hypothetical protein VFPPC_16538 [Pochonia chlamydosporia 170]